MSALFQIQELRRRATRAAMRTVLHASENSPCIIDESARTEILRVLICRPNHRLGNLLLLTPLIKALQQVFPAARVDLVLAGEGSAGLFRTFPNVGHIYILSRRMVRHPFQTTGIIMQMRQAKYDLAIDPCRGSQSNRLLTALASATHVIGINDDEPGAGDDPATAADPAPPHMAQWAVFLLRRAIAPRDALPADTYPTLDLQLSPAEQQRGQHILNAMISADARSTRTIGIFADARGPKRYAETWWMAFIEALRARVPGCTIVEIAPPDGQSRLSSRFPSFSSLDVREVAAVISAMSCFISADCGVMHLASASGIRTLGLFSVTDVARYAPYGHGSCAIDTNGKSPEKVAQLAGATIEAAEVRSSSSTPGPATHASPLAGKACIADSGQPVDPNDKD